MGRKPDVCVAIGQGRRLNVVIFCGGVERYGRCDWQGVDGRMTENVGGGKWRQVVDGIPIQTWKQHRQKL